MKRITDALELPPEITLGLPLTTVTGSGELVVENCGGIIEFGEERIKIKAKGCIIKIVGWDLTVKHITDGSICVAGRIGSVEFV